MCFVDRGDGGKASGTGYGTEFTPAESVLSSAPTTLVSATLAAETETRSAARSTEATCFVAYVSAGSSARATGKTV